VFFKEPTANEMAGIIQAASKKHGLPKHFISDQGSQFTSLLFREILILIRRGIKQRFRAIGKTASIAIIERFWRTMKEMLLLRLRPPLSTHDLWRRLEVGLVYYALWKPHQGLSGATPGEMYYGRRPAHIEAKRPRRAYELKDESDQQLFEISYLDPDCLLPVLKKAA
jgi:transposase InsO family protein